METLQKALQQLIGVVNALRVLSHDPDHGGTCLRLIQGVQVLTQRGNNALVPGQLQTTLWVLKCIWRQKEKKSHGALFR